MMCETLLVAFDFDSTITNDNTDIVAKRLLPKGKAPDKRNCFLDWTTYMGKVFATLNQNSISSDQILDAIVNVPPIDGIKELLFELHNLGHEIIIISDSNSIFIDQWLKNHCLDHCINEIFTNPAKINEDGVIVVDKFHTQDWCTLSSINICKGYVLKKYIQNQNSLGVYFDRVAYVGDGQNDLCPLLSLTEKDYAFPRKGYCLDELLSTCNYPMKAKILPWTNGTDIRSAIIGN